MKKEDLFVFLYYFNSQISVVDYNIKINSLDCLKKKDKYQYRKEYPGTANI